MKKFKPSLESLEPRNNPSSISLRNRIITIQGDAEDNVASVEITPSNRIVVSIDGRSGVYGLSDIREIRAYLSSGKDQLVYMNGEAIAPPVDDSELRVSVNGGTGDDVIVAQGGFAQMTLCGSSGDDIIVAEEMGVGVTIRGGTGDDLLIGSDGNDSIFGGAGSDVIFDERGRDTVDGGTGADHVDSTDGPGAGRDTIYYDFRDMLGHDGYDTLILV